MRRWSSRRPLTWWIIERWAWGDAKSPSCCLPCERACVCVEVASCRVGEGAKLCLCWRVSLRCCSHAQRIFPAWTSPRLSFLAYQPSLVSSMASSTSPGDSESALSSSVTTFVPHRPDGVRRQSTRPTPTPELRYTSGRGKVEQDLEVALRSLPVRGWMRAMGAVVATAEGRDAVLVSVQRIHAPPRAHTD